MRALLLLWLLALGDSKPYEPVNVNVMDYMRHYDAMMSDRPAYRWGNDDNDIDDDDDDDDEDEDCPKGCQCFPHVVQCSDKGLISIPEKIPADTRMIDLQNNDITDIKENDFKGLKDLYALFLINNKVSSIHPKAFRDLGRLRLLYLSYNLLTQIPANLPPNLLELRFFENRISRVQKEAFKGLRSLTILELGANPLANSGIELGAFDGVSTEYLGISEAKLTSVPKDLPSSMTELQLDYNKISKVEIEDFKRCKNIQRLSVAFNQIKSVENGSLASVPNVREVHLEHNKLRKVPPGLDSLRYLQVMFLHGNKINYVGVNDFCPSRDSEKKSQYSSISLFANPVRYWNIPPTAFRCVAGSRGVQLASNFRRRK